MTNANVCERWIFNLKDASSILGYAEKLKGSTLRKCCSVDILENDYSCKGRFGQVLEKYYFKYEPNSDSQADFPDAGLNES